MDEVIAYVVRDCQYVVRCSYCGKMHYHGRTEGHRVAHCGDSKGYVVRKKDGQGFVSS